MEDKKLMETEELVAAGMRILDEHFGGPEWADRIDLNVLNVVSTYTCVLGQLFGWFWRGCDALGINETYFRYGFGGAGSSPALNEVWRRMLTPRVTRRERVETEAVEVA